jgi:hypothetical protein
VEKLIGKPIDNTNLSDFWQRSKDMTDNRIENSELSRFIDFNFAKVDGTAAITPLDKVADYVIARDEDRGYIKGTVGEYLFVSRDLVYTRSGNYDPVGDFTIEAGVYKIVKVVPSDETTISNGIDGCVAFAYAYDGDDYVERVYTLEELQAVVNGKVDKVSGKSLSTNDYTNSDKNKLDGIETGAEVNVQSDWEQEDDTQDDFIKNKPSIPSKISDLENDSDFVHGISGSQMLRGTNSVTELTSSSFWRTSGWRRSAGSPVSISVTNLPVPDITLGWRLPSTGDSVGLEQWGIPMPNEDKVSLYDYTISCYAKGTGTLSIEMGRLDSNGNDQWTVAEPKTLNNVTRWTRYEFLIEKENMSNAVTAMCKFMNTSAGTIDICGMKLELGTQATQWSLSPYEMDNSNVDLSEIESDINTLETNQTQILSDIDALEHSLSTTKTATGNPISISDSAHVNAEELKVELEPIQDLHGYDKPWVGGAGKNKLPLVLADIKSANTNGSWSDNAYSTNGVTFTVLVDSDNNVICIRMNGTASEETSFVLASNSALQVLAGFSLKLNGSTGGSTSTYCIRAVGWNGTNTSGSFDGDSITFIPTSVFNYVEVRIFTGYTASNIAFYPMLRLATETDATFEPYSNICPISGYDETSVVRSGKNLIDWKLSGTDDAWSGHLPTGQYTISSQLPKPSTYGNWYFRFIDSDGNDSFTKTDVGLSSFTKASSGWFYGGIDLSAVTFIVPSGCATVKIGVLNADETINAQLELGSTATSYEPYTANTYTLQFGDTVYGAEVDFVSGVATVKYGYDEVTSVNRVVNGNRMAASVTLSQNHSTNVVGIICNTAKTELSSEDMDVNYISVRCGVSANEIWFFFPTDIASTLAEANTWFTNNPTQVCYELATPYTIQLTPQQIKMLKGNNVLSADGDMDLVYQMNNVVGDVKEWAEEHFIPYNAYNTPPVYGFHIDGNNSDPLSRVTYIADNANYTPAYMDYTADKFRYGSWRDIWFVKECKPCILNQDGTVKAYLNPNDYTKDIDGNTVVIDENLTGANVMIEFPKIWYKVVPDAGDVTSASVYFSPIKVDEDYKDYAYIDKDGVHKEHFYMPAYNGSVLSGTTVMRSISGQAVSKNLDASTEIAYAKANGDGWSTEDAGEVMLINFLLILIGKSTDTQTVFGRGIDTGGETAFNAYVTGSGNLKGLFYGTNTGTGLVKVFGIENWWGLQWRRYAGDVLDNGVRKVKLCYGNEDGSTTFDFNIDGTGYVDVGVTPSGTNSGYIRTMKFVHDGMYSAISDGSSSTYYCDAQWFNNAYHTIYALRGGRSADGVPCGAFCVALSDAPGLRAWTDGASVSYK